nr:MAG TPA: hypothetical protein [Caudoviricetes sp.]
MMNVPFTKEISDNYNKAHGAYLHSEKCRENRAVRLAAQKKLRKEATQKTLYWCLFGACFFMGSLIVLGWLV